MNCYMDVFNKLWFYFGVYLGIEYFYLVKKKKFELEYLLVFKYDDINIVYLL